MTKLNRALVLKAHFTCLKPEFTEEVRNSNAHFFIIKSNTNNETAALLNTHHPIH